MIFYSDEEELHYHKKVLLLASFWKLRFFELGSGLLSNELMMSCISGIPVEQNNPGYLKEFLVKICSFSRLITKYDNVFLHFTTARLITVYDNVLLQFVIAWLLQFSTTVFTIYDDSYYNLRQVLQFIDHDIITIDDSTEQLLCISFTCKRWIGWQQIIGKQTLLGIYLELCQINIS